MKYTFFLLCLLLALSCATKPERKPDISIASFPNIDPDILEIQIQAEKEKNVFISNDVSEKNFRRSLYLVPLIDRPGLPLLYKYTILSSDKKDAIYWSKLIANHRFNISNVDERLELLKELIEASILKGDFKKTNNLFDCKKEKLVVKLGADDYVTIGFYTTIPTDSAMWGGGIETSELGNMKINSFYSSLKDISKAKNISHYRGILVATTSKSRLIQSCEVMKSI